MTSQLETTLPGIDFAALLRQEGKPSPNMPDTATLAGHPALDNSPDFRGRAPLPILLSEQDIDTADNRRYLLQANIQKCCPLPAAPRHQPPTGSTRQHLMADSNPP